MADSMGSIRDAALATDPKTDVLADFDFDIFLRDPGPSAEPAPVDLYPTSDWEAFTGTLDLDAWDGGGGVGSDVTDSAPSFQLEREHVQEMRQWYLGLSSLKHPRYALQLAVRHRQHALMEYLLSHGVEIDLHQVDMATRNRDPVALGLLLKHGWDINAPLAWCEPPALALAVEDAHLTDWFLQRGADPNAQCSIGTTPLSYAVRDAPLATIHTLFERGGSIAHGQLLHFATGRKIDDRLAVVALLLNKGAPIDKIMYEDMPVLYEWHRPFGLGTALHDAAESGDLPMVRLLMAHGFKASTLNSCGKPPAHSARRHQHEAVARYLEGLAEEEGRSEPIGLDRLSLRGEGVKL